MPRQFDADHLGDAEHVGVPGGQRKTNAVRQLPRSCSRPSRAGLPRLSTPSIDSRGGGEVGNGIEGRQPNQSSMRRRSLPRSSLRPGQHLHHHQLGDHWGPVARDSSAMRWSTVLLKAPVVLDPRRGIGQDHAGARTGIGRHLAHRVRTLHLQRLPRASSAGPPDAAVQLNGLVLCGPVAAFDRLSRRRRPRFRYWVRTLAIHAEYTKRKGTYRASSYDMATTAAYDAVMVWPWLPSSSSLSRVSRVASRLR